MKKSIDGIISIEKFKESTIKILWVLKEGNVAPEDFDKEINVCEMFKNGKHKKNVSKIPSYRRMIYSTYRIFHPNVNYVNIPRSNKESYDEFLQVALININKFPGGNRSSPKIIAKAYYENKLTLFNQICDINPDLIIFGGTFNYFKKDFSSNGIILPTPILVNSSLKRTILYCLSNNKAIISTCHPSAIIKGGDDRYSKEISEAVKIWKNNCKIEI